MKRLMAMLLAVCLMPMTAGKIKADEINDSLVMSLGITDEGQLTDSCGNLAVDYEASFPTNQTRYPNVSEVRVIDSEGGKTKTFHTEYGTIKLTGDEIGNIAAYPSSTFEFWIYFDARKLNSNYNTIWNILEEGSTKSAYEWQFQTQTDKTINARMRMSVYNKDGDDNHKWVDPVPEKLDINGRWAHLVATKEQQSGGKERVTAYLDGALLKSSSQKITNPYTAANDLYMMIADRVQSLDIGAANIYNKVLSADEIQTLYDQSRKNYIPLPEEMALESISIAGGSSEEEATEINMYGTTLRLMFSNYIDESGLDSIVLQDQDGNVVAADLTVSEKDAKCAVMKLPDLEAEKIYKLIIGTGVGSVNGYHPEADEVYYYKAKDKREPLRFVSCEPANKILPLRNGMIKLAFSEAVNLDTAEEALTFTDENGREVSEISVSLDPEDSSCLWIEYPLVRSDVRYRLTLSQALQSQLGMALETPYDEEFIGENPYLFYQYDFSTYFTEEDEGRTIGQNEIPGLELSNETTGQTVGVSESGERYISMIPQLQSKEYQLVAKFPQAVTNGDIAVVEAKLRRTGGSSYASDLGRINGDANTNGPSFQEGKINNAALDKDDDGFSDIKYRIRRDTDGYYYSEIIYYVGGSPITYTKKYPSREITAVNQILMAHLYTTSKPEDNGYADSIDLKSVKIYIAKEVGAESSNLEQYNPLKNMPITVDLAVPANPDTVSADTIYLRNKKTQARIPWEFVSYDEDLSRAEFRLQDYYLSYGTEYEIVCEGLEGTNGIKSKTPFAKTFTTAPYSISVQEDASLRYVNGELSFKASLLGAGEKVTAILALYDLDGKIERIQNSDAVWSGNAGSVSISLKNDSIPDGFLARVYLVDLSKTAFAPLTDQPYELTIGQKPVIFGSTKENANIRLNFLGDSITAGHGTSKTYAQYLADKLRLSEENIRNYGISGTAVSRDNNYGEAFKTRYKKMNDQADIVFCLGGTNDFGANVTLGSISDSLTADTFCGSFKMLCDGLVTKYPDTRIVILTPIKRQVTNPELLEQIVEAEKQIAADYGITAIDLYHAEALDFSTLGFDKYTTDGLHPNESGHELMANYIYSKLIEMNVIYVK